MENVELSKVLFVTQQSPDTNPGLRCCPLFWETDLKKPYCALFQVWILFLGSTRKVFMPEC